jgi:hypothetical protein
MNSNLIMPVMQSGDPFVNWASLLFFSFIIIGLMIGVILGPMELREKIFTKGKLGRILWNNPFLIGWTCSLIVFGTVAFFGMKFYYVPPNTVVYTAEGKILKVYDNIDGKAENGWYVWESIAHRLMAEGRFGSYAQSHFSVPMTISPITPNPKVRRIRYEVQFDSLGKPEEFLSLLKITEKWGHKADQMILYHLYEFNEKHSKEIAEFYNPMDGQQQQKFAALLTDYLLEKPGFGTFTDTNAPIRIGRILFNLAD